MTEKNSSDIGVIRLTYRLNWLNIAEFALRDFAEMLLRNRSGKSMCILFGILALIVTMTRDLLTVVFLLTVFAFVPVGIRFVRLVRGGLGRERSVTVSDGAVRVESETVCTFPCSAIGKVRVGWSILMIGKKFAENGFVYYIIPLRAFSSGEERRRFTACFDQPDTESAPSAAVSPADGKEETCFSMPEEIKERQWIRRLSFNLEKEQLTEIMAQMEMIVADRRNALKYSRKAALCRGAAVLAAAVGAGILWPYKAMPVFTVGLLWLVSVWNGRRTASEGQIKNSLAQGGVWKNYQGTWVVGIEERGVHTFRPKEKDFDAWGVYQELIELRSAVCFYCPDRRHYQIISKNAFEDREDMESFVRLCQERGVKWIPLEASGVRRTAPSQRKWQKAESAAALFVMTAALFYEAAGPILQDTANRDTGAYQANERGSESGRPSYGFGRHGGIPFDEQLEVLASLGIDIPDSDREDYQDWIEEDEEYKNYIEGNPYVDILSYAGYGSYDEDTGERLYLDSVFWFDFEGEDISRDYIVILEGMNALGKGEFVFTGLSESGGGIDWESGSGEIAVSFSSNGHPYRFTTEMDHDRIDGALIDYCNEVLAAEQIPKRLYGMDDGGQGLILFYNSEEWAEEFYKKTGLRLKTGAKWKASGR